MARKIILVFFACILIFAFAVFMHLGGYKSVFVSQKEFPPLNLVYTEHIGPYNEVSPLLDQIEAWAKTHGLICEKTFGEYLDDPQTTEARLLRSHVGCLVTTSEAPRDLGGYQFTTLPAARYIWAKFQGAPAIGPFKVYPKMQEYIQERHMTVDPSAIELYTVHGKDVITEYLMLVRSSRPLEDPAAL